MVANTEPVEVLLVEVLFNRVMFWKLLLPEKMLVPEKVLLLASKVEEAAVIALLQLKLPFKYDSACAALLQAESPAPKKFELEATAANRLVVVALVMTAVPAPRVVA